MKRNTQFKKRMLLAGVFFMVIGFTSCSDDDDNGNAPKAVGMIYIGDNKSLSGNILNVESVTVGQDSWLAAVNAGDETTNNFIAQPVMVRKGTTSNAKLSFNETAIQDPDGHLISLKLYADNPLSGTKGEWDTFDEPIKLGTALLIKTITVHPDLTNYNWFEYFDDNEDGTLGVGEILKTYPSIFDFYNKDQVTPAEFLLMTYYSTDTDLDAGISEAEWKEGYLRMFSNWAADNFANFDTDKNDLLDLEEWWETFEESEWFETYDANSDTLLTEEELNNGFFTDWDLNNDGKIDESEFNNYWPFASNMKFTAPVWEW